MEEFAYLESNLKKTVGATDPSPLEITYFIIPEYHGAKTLISSMIIPFVDPNKTGIYR